MSDSMGEREYHARRIAEFRANGGKLAPPLDTSPLVVLTTIGAKSGQPRATMMSYTRDGERYVVVTASDTPQWFRNLVAHPEVTVEVGGEQFAAHATVAVGAERTRLFDQHASIRPNFIEYQRQAAQPLNVVALTRAE